MPSLSVLGKKKRGDSRKRKVPDVNFLSRKKKIATCGGDVVFLLEVHAIEVAPRPVGFAACHYISTSIIRVIGGPASRTSNQWQCDVFQT
jgi:hypothetical protein